jgi:hypothetical protein
MGRKRTLADFHREMLDLYPNGLTIHGTHYKSVAAYRRGDPISFKQEFLAWDDALSRR